MPSTNKPDFEAKNQEFIDKAESSNQYYGFDIKALTRFKPFLEFLYADWWKVKFTGAEKLPKDGPALIVGNQGSVLPWQTLMLTYGLLAHSDLHKRIHIMYDLDSIQDERLHSFLREIGFVPWSSSAMKRLFSKGEIVAVFPEGLNGLAKPYSQRYRLQGFDWTRFLPAVEENVPIFPLSTMGCDEAAPNFFNLSKLATFLKLPYFPVTPFFPWLPMPLNLVTMPGSWQMNIHNQAKYDSSGQSRDVIENTCKQLSLSFEGEIQAELNRMLRGRNKSRI